MHIKATVFLAGFFHFSFGIKILQTNRTLTEDSFEMLEVIKSLKNKPKQLPTLCIKVS